LWVAATAAWHPSLLAATGELPSWHRANDPPPLDSLDDTLLVVPSVSQDRLPSEWRRVVEARHPDGPSIVDAKADRAATVDAILSAAGLDPACEDEDVVDDFYALGYAYQQTMLLTKATRYASVFQTAKFAEVVVAAARAAVAGNHAAASEGVDRALDLLADARNHYYSVDFYLVDVALVAKSTRGEPLCARMASGQPTTLLADAELIGQLAETHPETLAALKRALAAKTACVAGGLLSNSARPAELGPEALLANLTAAQQVYRRHLGQEVDVYAQFSAAFSLLLPEILTGLGFRGALHAAFDGGPLPLAQQCKTRWGRSRESSVDALSKTPLDVSRPETWLALAESISESISRDHVATVLLAGWPGREFGAYHDLHRVARRSPLLGRMVTLGEYFDLASGAESWSTFHPVDYYTVSEPTAAMIAERASDYRNEAATVHRNMLRGLEAVVALPQSTIEATSGWLTLNPWNFDAPHFHGVNLLESGSASERGTGSEAWHLRAVPGCGFAWHADQPTPPLPAPIADGRRLRNEFLEVVISEHSGGIQSIRTHNDRGTRVSQRLAMDDRAPRERPDHQFARDTNEAQVPQRQTMIVEAIDVTCSNAVLGEITSRGWLEDESGELVARFTQVARLPRAMPAILIDVTLDAERPSEYRVANRIVWRDDDVGVRCGMNWVGRSVSSRAIGSAEWIEIEESGGRITLFPMGLSFHQRIGATMLETLLAPDGASRSRGQFAIGLDVKYPAQMALALLTADDVIRSKPYPKTDAARGWYFHVGANNVVLTHIEPLAASRSGVRLRLLETEGRYAETTIAAYRPWKLGQQTDFRGQVVKSLAIEDGELLLHLEPYQWLQLEAEW
jgi:alpha-mannosidase